MIKMWMVEICQRWYELYEIVDSLKFKLHLSFSASNNWHELFLVLHTARRQPTSEFKNLKGSQRIRFAIIFLSRNLTIFI